MLFRTRCPSAYNARLLYIAQTCIWVWWEVAVFGESGFLDEADLLLNIGRGMATVAINMFHTRLHLQREPYEQMDG